VITSVAGATEEVAGDAAILIDPKEVAEITKAMSRLSSSADLRKKLAEKGSKRVEDFSWEKTARETVQVLEKVYKSGEKVDGKK
jgi:glycosyltransferase involved in cell wall biosynthesis